MTHFFYMDDQDQTKVKLWFGAVDRSPSLEKFRPSTASCGTGGSATAATIVGRAARRYRGVHLQISEQLGAVAEFLDGQNSRPTGN